MRLTIQQVEMVRWFVIPVVGKDLRAGKSGVRGYPMPMVHVDNNPGGGIEERELYEVIPRLCLCLWTGASTKVLGKALQILLEI